MFRIKPTLKIVATILAQNEEDIIGTTIEHHIQQGVTQFIITNNRSTDRTRSIVEKYPEVIEIIDEPGDNHHQSKWVTRMAQAACKLSPDWIVHLDADELWCNLGSLRRQKGSVVRCEKMYLHPPSGFDFSLQKMRWYLNFNHVPIPQECKVAHRPDPKIVITHGNHEAEGRPSETGELERHHYPIRSYNQWESKAKKHEALKRRNSICKRWERWYDLLAQGKLGEEYRRIVDHWKAMIKGDANKEHFLELLGFWATPEMLDYFKKNDYMPRIEEWS
jgi:glycosyltransferase involved in cell wall biosynthesis